MTENPNGTDDLNDEVMNRLVRDTDAAAERRFTRPSWDTIRDFALGLANDEQIAEVKEALLRSAGFRQQMRDILADLERLDDPGVQAAIGKIDPDSITQLPPLYRSRFIVSFGNIAHAARSGAGETVMRIEGFLSGLKRAGAAPLELMSATAGLRGAPTSLEGIPDVWDHVRRAVTKGDEVRCAIGDIGSITVKHSRATDGLEVRLHTKTAGRLEIWRSEEEGMTRLMSITSSDEFSSIPITALEPGTTMFWVEDESAQKSRI